MRIYDLPSWPGIVSLTVSAAAMAVVASRLPPGQARLFAAGVAAVAFLLALYGCGLRGVVALAPRLRVRHQRRTVRARRLGRRA